MYSAQATEQIKTRVAKIFLILSNEPSIFTSTKASGRHRMYGDY